MSLNEQGMRKNEKKEVKIRKSGLGTSVFMMEMIMVIFFFSLCAAVCIMLFVKADTMSRLALDTNQAVTKAESLAELFQAGELEEYTQYPETEKGISREKDSYSFAWDSHWKPIDGFSTEEGSRDANYYGYVTVTGKEESAGFMETAKIQITESSNQKVLYELTVSSYSGI